MTSTDIIPVYRDGQYDHQYMLRIKAKTYFKEKASQLVHRTDLIFTEHRLTYN